MHFFLFRRSFRLLPGLRLAPGKRSTSLSVSGRGTHFTGLSYTEVSKPPLPDRGGGAGFFTVATPSGDAARGWPWVLLAFAILLLIAWSSLGTDFRSISG
jgi:hypothetical protein